MIFGKVRWLFHPPIAKKMRNFQHQLFLGGYCHRSTDSRMSVTSQEVGDVTVTSCWWRHENFFPIFFEKWKSWKEFQQSSKIFFSSSEVKGIGKELRSNQWLEVLAYNVASWWMVRNGASGVFLAYKRRVHGFRGTKSSSWVRIHGSWEVSLSVSKFLKLLFRFFIFFIFRRTNSHRNSSKLRLAGAGGENLKFKKTMKIFEKPS